MRGMANSINVSTAAAIVLYALSCRAEAEGSSVGVQQIKLPAPPWAPAS